MKSLDLIFQIYGTLRQKEDKLRNESERGLVISICIAAGGIVSSIIGLAFYLAISLKAGIVSFLLASSLLLPISALVGIYIWQLIPPLWLRTGNAFLQLRYLEYEYNEDIQRIEKLKMSDARRAPLLVERYKRYLEDTSRVKEKIFVSKMPAKNLLDE
jgi:hypothetical protein